MSDVLKVPAAQMSIDGWIDEVTVSYKEIFLSCERMKF